MTATEHYLTVPPTFRSHRGQLHYSDPFNNLSWAVANLWKGVFDTLHGIDFYSNDRSYGVGFECTEGADAVIWKNWWIV